MRLVKHLGVGVALDHFLYTAPQRPIEKASGCPSAFFRQVTAIARKPFFKASSVARLLPELCNLERQVYKVHEIKSQKNKRSYFLHVVHIFPPGSSERLLRSHACRRFATSAQPGKAIF
jgi:hypothetical protein